MVPRSADCYKSVSPRFLLLVMVVMALPEAHRSNAIARHRGCVLAPALGQGFELSIIAPWQVALRAIPLELPELPAHVEHLQQCSLRACLWDGKRPAAFPTFTTGLSCMAFTMAIMSSTKRRHRPQSEPSSRAQRRVESLTCFASCMSEVITQ
ncbi:hypothetical protein JG688_00006814 [Phytophthora aleatoria]|uniref:Secreted protein n=1 Tax=Phytophthora aleatoria TaxID=2496075 RepID=A0A8J5M5L6_9STRA|nr:hypothetical protein JG688_00006814 [Phytophthora aleatoria]